ncbi:MAG: glycosyltransferase family 4 protein [Chrysiogenales bacterium]|nr:MAG: glycosyltransferase family 4 protein [Chrysiogenales bacterium]
MAEKVAIIHDWLNGMRGGEKVLEEILALYPQADIFTLFYDPDEVSPQIRSKKVQASQLNRNLWIRKYYQYFLPLFPRHIEAFDLNDYSLVISSSHCVAKGAIPAPDALHVSYIHSPMRYAWDRYHSYFSQAGFWRRKIIQREISRLRIWDVSSSARVDHFVANSSYVRQRIEKYYRRQATVIHPPVDTDFFQPAPRPSRDYFLLVSALVPYKNVETVVETFRGSAERLVVVGQGIELKRLLKRAGPGIEFLAAVRAEKLRELYQNARALVFAGIEDFGIAFAESQACATPVIALDRGGVRDIVIDRVSGVLYSEATVAGLKKAVADFSRLDLSAAAIRENSLRFSSARFRAEFQQFINSRNP